MSDQTGRYSGKPTGGNQIGDGVRNGQIPLSKMRFCASQTHWTPAVSAGYLFAPASVLLDQMVAAARADGHVLKVIAGYRDLAQQKVMRRVWCNRGNCNGAAVPGTSNHGWGTAIDVERHQPGTTGIVNWLKANAVRFGWDHPRWAGDGIGTEEPWHWQFIQNFQPAGDPNEVGTIAWTVENGDRLYRVGERDAGENGPIARFQGALRKWSRSRPDVVLADDLEVDGWYGERTHDAVELFQTLEHIVPTDATLRGVAGPTTRGRLAALTGISL